MGLSKNAQTLGVHLADDIVDMIERRAAALGVTKSRFVAMLFEKWRADKYPAISATDSTGRAMVKQQMDVEKSRAANKGQPVSGFKLAGKLERLGLESLEQLAEFPPNAE